MYMFILILIVFCIMRKFRIVNKMEICSFYYICIVMYIIIFKYFYLCVFFEMINCLLLCCYVNIMGNFIVFNKGLLRELLV